MSRLFRVCISPFVSALLLITMVGVADAGSVLGEGFGVVREVPLPPSGKQIDSSLGAMSEDQRGSAELGRGRGFQLTPQQIEETKNPPVSVYRVDSGRYGSTAVTTRATANNPVTFVECQQVYEGGYRQEFWVKNRFAECQYILLSYSYYAKLGSPPVGTATAKAIVVFNMQPNTRQIQTAVRLSDWAFTGTVPPTAKIGSQFGCMGIGLAKSTAHCDKGEQGSLRTISSWQASPIDAWSFLPQGEDPADTNLPAQVNNEKRTLYNIARYFYTYGGPGPYDNYNQTPTSTLPYRCDLTRAGNPNYARSSDCVFHGATGWLTMSTSDSAIAESAQFIRDAQTNITTTYPGIEGKYVPGQQGRTEPLRRLYYDTKLRDANRRTSVASCVKNWGSDYTKRPDGKTNDCDEYPFAATYEGSFTVTDSMIRSYAVRPLLSEHNQEVGRRLGAFVADDHLLDGDAYYVTAAP